MQTNPLLYGLIGFFIGGLLVALAANSWFGPAKPAATHEMPMSEMTSSLRDKKGDAYDQMFISHMIEHHQAAVDTSRLSEQNAKHEEIKTLSREIIAAQEKEIQQMRQWQQQWGYGAEHKGGH